MSEFNGRLIELKLWGEYFNLVEADEKRWELRKNDRHFRAGDVLRLREWLPTVKEYTGREVFRLVTFVLMSPQGVSFGLKPGFAILSIRPLRLEERRWARETVKSAGKPGKV